MNLNINFDENEINFLIDILRSQGITYLIGSNPSWQQNVTLDPIELIRRLAACGYPLLENACIALFILHPDFAPSVVTAMQTSETEIAENIAVVTLATLYLQQWWLFRLTFALGQLPSFPEAPFAFLWQERRLPLPSEDYGRSGLLALQEYQQQKYGLPLNFLDDWQNQINHLLAQEEVQQRPFPDDVKQKLVELSMQGWQSSL